MINYFIVICPQCRKRLDEIPDVEECTVAATATAVVGPVPQLEVTGICHSESVKVRTRPDHRSY